MKNKILGWTIEHRSGRLAYKKIGYSKEILLGVAHGFFCLPNYIFCWYRTKEVQNAEALKGVSDE
jgi:hypothetical protein